MGIAPVISAMWFPPSERQTATAIASTSNYGGTALVFWLGSTLVPSGKSADDTRDDLWRFSFGVCVVTGLLFLAILLPCSFPSRPPSAPSRSATVAREGAEGFTGVKQLLNRKSFWLLCLAYSIICGIFQGWGSMLGPNMQAVLPEKEAEAQAGLLGCWGAIAGIGGGLGLGFVADRWRSNRGRRKALLLFCCALAAFCFLGFAIACTSSLLPTKWAADENGRLVWMYVLSILGSLFVNATTPLFYELSVEATYPIAEGLTTTALNILQSLVVICFTVVPPAVPSIVTAWMNWAVAGACAVVCVMLLPLREPRRRLAVDGGGGEEASSSGAVNVHVASE